ncbi:acyltransferase [bacterium]|nr:acyltransferase [bacterium]
MQPKQQSASIEPLNDQREAKFSPATAQRSVGLDLVRTFAILLVVVRHMRLSDCFSHNPFVRAFEKLCQTCNAVGWIGVDLFFVLSGFLVSGLMFREYERAKKVDVGRFLIRRGFKIYPTFWAFLIAVFFLGSPDGHRPAPVVFLHDFFFLQNYLEGVAIHPWSLAVEEHFYLLLSLLVFAFCRSRLADPMKMLLRFSFGICFGVLALRCYSFFALGSDWGTLNFRTHYRVDGLFWGVILSYAFHYGRSFPAKARPIRPLLLLLGLLLWTPPFLCKDNVNLTVGPTLFSWGAICFTLVGAASNLRPSLMLSPLVAIGVHSYSIYLWHPLYQEPLTNWIFNQLPNQDLAFAASVAAVCAIGILLSKLIEQPFLRLRERLVPADRR